MIYRFWEDGPPAWVQRQPHSPSVRWSAREGQICKYFKKARAAAKRDDTKDFWDVIRKEQRLLDLLSVIIARANADIIRNLPARGRYAPSSPSEPPSASSSPQYEVDDDDDDRKENYSPQWEASSPGYD